MAITLNAPSQVRPYATFSAFPATGAVKTVYIAEDTNYMYRWNGTAYEAISVADLVGYVPYTGATSDVNIGTNDMYVNKLWLYDAVNDNYGSTHYTDGNYHIEDADGHKLLVIEDGFMQIHKTDTIQSNLYTSGLTATRDHYLPDASGTIALTSDLAGYVPTSRTITINGTTQDLSANRSWTIALATPTLDQVTTAGNTTANLVTVGALTINASITASGAIARGSYFNNTLIAAANNDVLVGLDILNTFTNGSFTGVANYNIRTTGLITKQYFRSPTVNQGNHTIAFGFGGAGEQVKFIASATGASGRGNLYIASVSGDTAVATTANANALFTDTSNTFYKSFTIEQSGLTSGNGLYLYGNQPNAITNGIYFRYGETRVAILSKPHGSNGYADFRIAIVPLGGPSTNNPPQESDTKFMITKDTTNVLINTTTDAGYKLDVNGTARVQGDLSVSRNQNAATFATISNTTSGNSSFTELSLISNTTSGAFYIGKYSTLKTAYKIVSANDSYLLNAIGGDISILNDFATGKIKFSSGGASTAQVTLATTGNLLINTTTDIASSKLTIESTTQGVLFPRMTQAQRNAIASPAIGLEIYQTDATEGKYIYKSSGWTYIG